MTNKNNNHIGIVETETEALTNALPSPHMSAIASATAEGRGTEGEGAQRVQTSEDPAFSSARVNRQSGAPLERVANTRDFEPRTLNFEPRPPRRATGKVAHLPKLIRDQVNQMLDDGVTFREIAKKLPDLGYPGFFYQNIQRWRSRGHQAWLREREERIRAVVARLSQNSRRG